MTDFELLGGQNLYYKIVSLRTKLNTFFKAAFSHKADKVTAAASQSETEDKKPKSFEEQRQERLHKHAGNITSTMHSHH